MLFVCRAEPQFPDVQAIIGTASCVLLAYAGPKDSLSSLSPLRLLNTADGTDQDVSQIAGSVVGISPNGTAVLHGSNPQSGLMLTSVEDGSTTAIWSDYSYERRLRGHRWDDGEIQLVFAEADGLYVQDVMADATRRVASFPATPDTFLGQISVGWSSDGRFLAAWVPGECLRPVWFNCEARQHILHLIDTESGSVTQIGQGNFDGTKREGAYAVRFSPDGGQIAYVHRPFAGAFEMSYLYVIDLP